MSGAIPVSRAWAMPSRDTFSVPPIRDFLSKWLAGRPIIIDPFARNSRIGTIRNDLDPATEAEHHLDVVDFAEVLRKVAK